MSRYKRHLLDSLDSFAPGGGCPIHLHDELDKGRYRVIHRLGRGGYGVVWLCRDLKSEKPQYVAVKILWAEETERVANEKFCVERIKRLCADEPDLDRYLCLPTRDFFAKSANGRHICLVYPVLGPKASMAREIFKPRYNDYCKRLRDISRDCIKALDLLHRRNICHAGESVFLTTIPAPPPC